MAASNFSNVVYMGQLVTIDSRCRYIAHDKNGDIHAFEEMPIAMKVSSSWSRLKGFHHANVGKILQPKADWIASVRTVNECAISGQASNVVSRRGQIIEK